MRHKASTIGAGLAALALASLVCGPSVAQVTSLQGTGAAAVVEVITGGVDGIEPRLAADLAAVLGDGGRRVVPVVGTGSLQNLADLRALPGLDLAFVQTDVLNRARKEGLVQGLDGATYVAKLYNAEFHLVARHEVASVAELAGKKVNFDVAGSGTAVTGPALFRLLKVSVEATAFDNSTAIDKLRSGEIAALAFVGGKPAPLLADQRFADGFHLLPIPLRPEVLDEYLPSQLGAVEYPDLVEGGAKIDTVAVGTALVAVDAAPDSERHRRIAGFVEAFFDNFAKLGETSRHPKWQEVSLAAELPGWRRFGPAEEWLKKRAPVAGTEELAAAPELRDSFTKFVDDRSRSDAARPASDDQKSQMFEEFERWHAAKRPR
jgi:TRAP-type uncharacterized transport system substrate-binding protein